MGSGIASVAITYLLGTNWAITGVRIGSSGFKVKKSAAIINFITGIGPKISGICF